MLFVLKILNGIINIIWYQKTFNAPNASENFLARIKNFHLVPNDI